MVTENQQKALKVLLMPWLGSNPTTAVVEPFVGVELSLRLPVSTAVIQVAEWIIDQALTQDRPTMLIRIIRRLDDGSSRVASLVELADRLEADPSGWRAPVPEVDWSLEGDPLQVLDGRPFVDRSAFRRLIPRLGSLHDTPSCTLVQGNDGHGKTYLTEFCKGLASYWERKQPNLLRVGSSQCPTSTLSDLTPDLPAIDLATGLDADFTMMPRPHEDEHRYARNLATWILETTPEGALPALAIFDGFDRAGVPAPVLTFIEELVAGAQQDADAASRLRIMLLGYDQGRLEKADLAFETCVLEHVGSSHLDRWFRKRYPGQPSFRYEDTVDMIADRLPDDGSMRMRRLNALVRAAGAGFKELG